MSLINLTFVWRDGFRLLNASYDHHIRFFMSCPDSDDWPCSRKSSQGILRASLPPHWRILQSTIDPLLYQHSVNFPDCMVNDQSVNDTYKNLMRRLYEAFSKWKALRETTVGLINDLEYSFEDSSFERFETWLIFNHKSWERSLLQMVLKLSN